MRPLIQEIQAVHTPESLVECLADNERVALLRTAAFDSPSARYSFVAARPFLSFRSAGSRCEIIEHATRNTQFHFGNPWHLLDSLMSRYELLEELDLPFPLGGCFGYWGYDLKNFVEPKLSRRAANDLELPDCHVAFYDSLVVFDHQLGKTWIVSTGLAADGSRSEHRAEEQLQLWRAMLSESMPEAFNGNCRSRREEALIPSGRKLEPPQTRDRISLSHRMGEGRGEGLGDKGPVHGKVVEAQADLHLRPQFCLNALKFCLESQLRLHRLRIEFINR